ncbi:LysE family translocator [Pseudomonas rhizoryzae]|uniref:LysE family translocator n=1 Tax=Pseudomonas rhizoryzae TaxID=2571129 RepID=UPI00073625D0|nr:LysE family translocator [Pseudomonas rhizoryzae]KTT28342.1 lysine transporter LysE [Pseudomonas psychrotolerans]KTT28845.1 lysine transporter LysE [Pseudomonas psychrotolerans]KTT71079.1 lysine transporter LysE [Pseudomonas psychrotolerans]
MTPDFLLTTLIVVASPGTGALLTMAAGISYGRRAALLAATGCTLGILPHLLLTLGGLTALLQARPLLLEGLRYLGVAYLLYLGYRQIRQANAFITDASCPVGERQLIRQAILLNLINPKLSLFFWAYLPQFLNRQAAAPRLQMLLLAGIFIAMTWLVFTLYGLGAAQMRGRLLASPRLAKGLSIGFACAFFIMAMRLCWTNL